MLPAKKANPMNHRLAEIEREAEERDAQRRAVRGGFTYVNLAKIPISLAAVALLPEDISRSAKCASIEIKQRDVALAAYDPSDPAVEKIIADLKSHSYEPKVFLCSVSGLEQAWNLYKFAVKISKSITGKVDIEEHRFGELIARLGKLASARTELEKAVADRASTTQFMEIILAGAMANRASDIHIEAEEKTARVRYRLDGLLHDASPDFPARSYETLLSRIKLLSGLKMNVHGEPQDGRFTIKLPSKEVEVRVSIIPSEFGETVVMRVLDPDAIQVELSDLGLRADDLVLVEEELAKPNGLILNTGPTGSGKTTTLYAFLRKLSNPEVKMITIEDPIEYRIGGVEQTQTSPEVGYTFATGLRAILRQDPDVILVGEIRDHETADIALQASLTGHLVLSTLHTNSAIGAVPRLVDLDVKPASIGPALSLVIAQRLVRKLCPDCRTQMPLPPELQKDLAGFLETLPARVDRSAYTSPLLYGPGGCEACNHLGYRGRVGIFEFFRAGPELEQLILKEVSEASLRELADKQGMVGIQQDGILKAISGVTSLDEIISITGPLPWAKKSGPPEK